MRQRTRWNQPKWWIAYTNASQFVFSSRVRPHVEARWTSVKGPFNLRRDAEMEIRREIMERGERLIREQQERVS